MPNQIKLLGHPNQRAYIAKGSGAHCASGSEIGHRRRCRRSQHDLACHRALLLGVPDRLSRDTVATATDLSFEYVHMFHVAYSKL